MSLLYKRSNLFWPWLIKFSLTHRAWNPLVEITRKRHVRFRKSLQQEENQPLLAMPMSAGV